jgi:hypothetical protein
MRTGGRVVRWITGTRGPPIDHLYRHGGNSQAAEVPVVRGTPFAGGSVGSPHTVWMVSQTVSAAAHMTRLTPVVAACAVEQALRHAKVTAERQ